MRELELSRLELKRKTEPLNLKAEMDVSKARINVSDQFDNGDTEVKQTEFDAVKDYHCY